MRTAENQSNVVALRCGAFLNECEADLKQAEPWSEEKTHIMYLLSQYINHPVLAVHHKMRALAMIVEYSDMAGVLAEAGYQRTITVSQLEHDILADRDKNAIKWEPVANVGN